MLRNRFANLTPKQKAKIAAALAQAYDFDSRDPLYGLSRTELSGPRLERRTVLRLMAAAGTLTAAHLLPGLAPRQALAQQRGGTLQAGWSGVSEIATLDPARIDQVEEFQISSNVLSGLTHINGDFVAQPDLAEDWKVSDDGTEYTFNLRQGVTFHNGDPFTADDVIFTWQRSRDPQKSIQSAVVENIKDIEKLGVAEFNRLCRESVFTYRGDWERLSERIGYWLDYEHPYVTCSSDYIETVWWLLRRLHDRDLLYRGHRVLPYCPRCGTVLSSHELALGYEEVTTNSVYVTFPLAGDPSRELLIWTTTPWTLLANVAVAVRPDLEYGEYPVGDRRLILATARAAALPSSSAR